MVACPNDSEIEDVTDLTAPPYRADDRAPNRERRSKNARQRPKHGKSATKKPLLEPMSEARDIDASVLNTPIRPASAPNHGGKEESITRSSTQDLNGNSLTSTQINLEDSMVQLDERSIYQAKSQPDGGPEGIINLDPVGGGSVPKERAEIGVARHFWTAAQESTNYIVEVPSSRKIGHGDDDFEQAGAKRKHHAATTVPPFTFPVDVEPAVLQNVMPSSGKRTRSKSSVRFAAHAAYAAPEAMSHLPIAGELNLSQGDVTGSSIPQWQLFCKSCRSDSADFTAKKPRWEGADIMSDQTILDGPKTALYYDHAAGEDASAGVQHYDGDECTTSTICESWMSSLVGNPVLVSRSSD